MPLRPAAFAVPGDLTSRTGGYIYDRTVLEHLRDAGRAVQHIQLPDGFPDPTPAQMDKAFAQLAQVPVDVPILIDGLAFGALDPARVARIMAPIVALVHHPLSLEPGQDTTRAEWLRRTETRNLAHARQVIVTSPHISATLVNSFGVHADALTVALPGTPRPAGPPQPVHPPLILSVGILIARKGHDVLIRALDRIRDLDWQAQIAGRPQEPATVRQLNAIAEQTGLTNRIRFLGEVDAETLSDAYRGATIFALASRYEGYGMVFSEALAHGLPIVACRAGAVPETVPQSAGILCPVDDAAAVADALRTLLTDPARHRAMSESARHAGANLPGWAETAALISDVLDRV